LIPLIQKVIDLRNEIGNESEDRKFKSPYATVLVPSHELAEQIKRDAVALCSGKFYFTQLEHSTVILLSRNWFAYSFGRWRDLHQKLCG
jgi:superfamily II DNA/RNA helicase